MNHVEDNSGEYPHDVRQPKVLWTGHDKSVTIKKYKDG